LILILSVDKDDSTNQVIDWINALGKDFYRINGDELLDHNFVIKIDTNEPKTIFSFSNVLVPKKLIKSKYYKVVWFRRWATPHNFVHNFKPFSLKNQITQYCQRESNGLSNIFYQSLKHCDWLNHPSELEINKLSVLEEAKKVGLIIPNTLVCSTKTELIAFKKSNGRIISKSIRDPVFFNTGGNVYSIYTYEIQDEDIEVINDFFFPSLFQELIEKEYELRIFYLDKVFYSMAIFSQANTQTKVDFRHYDHVKPNRRVPYLLPKSIQKKLIELMKILNMSCGSIDMIKKNDGDYVFLEVNPVGQFGMVSFPCNYFLEKKVSESLIKRYEK